MIGLVLIAVIAALAFAALNFSLVKRKSPGNELMREIAGSIRDGADAFLSHEYKVIAKIALLITVMLAVVVSWQTACALSSAP